MAMEDLAHRPLTSCCRRGCPSTRATARSWARSSTSSPWPTTTSSTASCWTRASCPGGHRFVDAPEVGTIYERGVVLKIDAAAAEACPSRAPTRASIEVGPDDMVKGGSRQAPPRLGPDLRQGLRACVEQPVVRMPRVRVLIFDPCPVCRAGRCWLRRRRRLHAPSPPKRRSDHGRSAATESTTPEEDEARSERRSRSPKK